MDTRTRRCLALLGLLFAFGSGACTIVTAPPPGSGPPPHASAAAPAGPRFQDNTWRPGGDLRTFDLPQGGPEACANACEKEPACYAYDYVNPSRPATA